MTQTPKNWIAVIPAKILYDQDLTDRDKIIYAIISNLTYQKGYCYASNKYIADCLNCSEKTIQRTISRLAKYNHIKSHVLRSENGTSRKIELTVATGGTNMSRGVDKNDQPIGQKCLDINIDNNSIKIKEYKKTILDHINTKYNRNFKILKLEKLKARLKNYTIEQIILAIDKAHGDQYHIDNGFKYLTPEYFLRNDEIIEKWINTNTNKNGKGKTGKQTFEDYARSISQDLNWQQPTN